MDEVSLASGLRTAVSLVPSQTFPDAVGDEDASRIPAAPDIQLSPSGDLEGAHCSPTPPDIQLSPSGDLEGAHCSPTPPAIQLTPSGDLPTTIAIESNFIVGRSVKARVLELINQGSFGDIHRGVMLETDEEVVVKLEKQRAPWPQLLAEADIYRHLQGGAGIPKFYWGGLYDYAPFYNVLVIEYLGPNIQDLFAYCHHKFSLKTVLMLADQMLDIIRFIHENRFIYRDIKPDNFLIGRGADTHRIYIVDFGLAKKYVRGQGLRRHSSIHYCHPMVGTTRYASLHAHRGEDLAPRDDMESFAYVWAYLLRGNLPWQGIKSECKEDKFAAIKEAKLTVSSETLCEGLPSEFASYLEFTKHMKMDETPNYRKIKAKFRALAETEGIAYDWQYDWNNQYEKTGVQFRARGLGDHGHESS